MGKPDGAQRYDLAVVGAGIVGLAHALAAAKRGLRVVVLERDAQANQASVRNFGFITVTGQAAGDTWNRALRSRELWAEVAAAAGIPVLHRGAAIVAERPEAWAVLQEFAAGGMGVRCSLLTPAEMATRLPALRHDRALGCLWSPHELRVEPRQAIPKLAKLLAETYGVAFAHGVQVRAVAPPDVETSAGIYQAERVVVCPGNDFLTLFPDLIARHRLEQCKLHMLRLAPQPNGWRLPGSIMTDLSLVRYLGFADCPSVPALRARLERETPETLRHGIHLIVVQSADGSLVVGDSHHYAATPDPFAPAAVDDLILRHATAALAIPDPRVVERWIGVYPYTGDRPCLIEKPADRVRLVIVTSGTGMSTAFAIAEEVIDEWSGDSRA